MLTNNIDFRYKNQPAFSAKKPCIRRAGDMVLLANRFCPRVSVSNITDFSHMDKSKYALRNTRQKTAVLRTRIDTELDSSKSDLSKIKAIIKTFSALNVGNCVESAYLSYLAAKINEIEDINLGYIYETYYDCNKMKLNDLDHAVVIVENGGNPYIIDAWLGFADFLPAAILRYKQDFKYHFDLKNNNLNTTDIDISPVDNNFINLVNRIPKEDLQKAFPELMLSNINKNKNIFQKIKKFFVDLFELRNMWTKSRNQN